MALHTKICRWAEDSPPGDADARIRANPGQFLSPFRGKARDGDLLGEGVCLVQRVQRAMFKIQNPNTTDVLLIKV